MEELPTGKCVLGRNHYWAYDEKEMATIIRVLQHVPLSVFYTLSVSIGITLQLTLEHINNGFAF